MTQVQILRAPLVEAPRPARHKSQLLDVAEVHEGMAWIDPNDMFVTWNCADGASTDVCGTDQTPPKTPRIPRVVDGAHFAVYLAGICKPLTEDVLSEIDRVFDLRESRQVEKQFEVEVLGAGTTVTGTPVSAAHALGLMENALGDEYAGVGTIHMSPMIATLLLQNQLIVDVGGKFYTHLGTKVVVGTGYTSTVMYGTGDVQVYRGERVLIEQPDMSSNTQFALAERAYIVVGDCISLKLTGIPMPQSTSTPGDPTDPPDVQVETGTDTVEGPSGSWTAPSGTLRSVSVVVTSGSVEVDGDEVTAPNTVNFDADNEEGLDPPVVTASSPGDRAVVAWVVIP